MGYPPNLDHEARHPMSGGGASDASAQERREQALRGAYQVEIDKVTHMLCSLLKRLERADEDSEIANMTELLNDETQVWWQERKRLDAARKIRLREEALKKLTPDEREALGY